MPGMGHVQDQIQLGNGEGSDGLLLLKNRLAIGGSVRTSSEVLTMQTSHAITFGWQLSVLQESWRMDK